MLLGIVEQLQNVITHDDTSLPAENILNTHDRKFVFVKKFAAKGKKFAATRL
jgi:hypothetical protein